jgi:hypothetical protein
MRGESTVESFPVGDDILGDAALSQNLMNQAAKMAAEAKGLLAESERLQQQAIALRPPLNNTVASTSDSAKKKAGRPKKAAVVG